MKPTKIGKPEIVLEILAEGGSLTLMKADVFAWEDPSRPGGGFEIELSSPDGKETSRTWVQDTVFWVERDERTLACLFDEDELPVELFAKTEVQESFEEALHGFMDPYQWWLLSPGVVQPDWRDAIEGELEQRFPEWKKKSESYEDTWPSCRRWFERLVLNESPWV